MSSLSPKESSVALHERLRTTEAIINSVLDGIISIDKQGTVESFNPAAEKLFLYTAEEVIGKNVKMLMPTPFFEDHDSYLLNYLETGYKRIIGIGREVVGKRKDGTTFPLELAVSEVQLEDRIIFTGILRDISDRRRAAELKETLLEERERHMVQLLQARREIKEIKQERFESGSMEELGAERLTRALESLGMSNSSKSDLAQELEQGALELLKSNEDLQQANEKNLALASELDRVASDILTSNRALRKSNTELKQFAYVASHDLQEPLRKIIAFCKLLEEECASQLDETAQKYLDFVVDGAARMRRLVTDLLDYSRIETQGKELVSTNARMACEEAIRNLETIVQENNAKITLERLPTIQADYAQLVRLFQNLIGNAIKYRRDETPEVHITAGEDGRNWVISVRDNGIGIPAQFRERIFVMFQRLHSKNQYSGTGIGLSICQRIVDRMWGSIWVESEEGQGSTFFISLPKEIESFTTGKEHYESFNFSTSQSN